MTDDLDLRFRASLASKLEAHLVNRDFHRTLAQLRCDLTLDLLQDSTGPDSAGPDSAGPDSTGPGGPGTGELVLRGPRQPAVRERTKHGRPVRVVLHLDVATLLGANDQPGEITGLGPVPAPIARQLASQSNDWWRLLTDPHSGVCRDYGRLKTPGQDLTDLIVARDTSCRAPYCDQPIDDLDHTIERQHGGLTTDTNLEGLSAHCHTEKTDGGWQPHLHPDGTLTWTSPHGHTHTVPATDHRLAWIPPEDPAPPRDPDPPPF